MNDLDACIVHTQHGEIIVECRDDIADQMTFMESAFQRIIPEVSFIVDIRVADSWGRYSQTCFSKEFLV